MKIGLIGCPGTGKSTIAGEVAQQLNIPLVLSRTLTKPILERDGYVYSSSNYIEFFLAEQQREFELVDQRIKAECPYKKFITDRTTLENFAYALLRLDTYSREDINLFQDVCCQHLSNYTHLFYFPRTSDIRENGLRTVNIYFQMKVDYLIQGLIREWNISVINMPVNAKNKKQIIINKL